MTLLYCAGKVHGQEFQKMALSRGRKALRHIRCFQHPRRVLTSDSFTLCLLSKFVSRANNSNKYQPSELTDKMLSSKVIQNCAGPFMSMRETFFLQKFEKWHLSFLGPMLAQKSLVSGHLGPLLLKNWGFCKREGFQEFSFLPENSGPPQEVRPILCNRTWLQQYPSGLTSTMAVLPAKILQW